MNHEFEAKAWLPDDNGIRHLVPVDVCFEADGYKPLGLWVADEYGDDVTTDVTQEEYDRLYQAASTYLLEEFTDAAEYIFEGER